MIDAAIAVSRFLFDASALFLWGSAVYLWLLVPSGMRATFWTQLTAARWIAAVALAASLLALLPLRTVLIAGDWSAAANLDMLGTVVVATNIGIAWAVQAVQLAVLLIVMVWLPGKAAPAMTALLSAGMLASLSLTGHAAMNAGLLGLVQQLNNSLHLLVSGFWIGALPVVLLLLRRPGETSDAAIALRRFSNAGHVAVALVVLSGVISATLVTGRFPPRPTSLYQILLLAKIALVAAMILAAIVNRYVFVPRLRRNRGDARALAAGTVLELILAAGVIGLVAVFGMMEPY